MTTRTIARLYDSHSDAVQVVQDLEAAGIPHADISLVGRDAGTAGTAMSGAAMPETVAGETTAAGYSDPAIVPAGTTGQPTAAPERTGAGASIGTILGGGAGLLAGIGALAIPGVGPVVAAGWLIATLTGAGVGAAAGGLLGALTSAGVSEDDAHVYAEGVRRGGNLVTVRADETQAAVVEQIMNSRSYADPAQRRTDYAADGWSRFDAAADPLAPGAPPIRPI